MPTCSLALALLALAASPQEVSAPLRAAGGTLVVLNKSEATAALVDPTSGEVRRTLPTGVGPHEAAVSPDGRTAVVCDYGQQEPGGTLTVIDLVRTEVARTISLGEHRRPHGIEYQADGRHVVVTVEQSRAIVRVDVVEGAVTDVFPTEAQVSHMVALAPDGARAFVANIGSGSVTVIDLAEGGILAQIATGAGAEGIAITPDGAEVWVTNRAVDTLSVIDAEWLEVTATIPCGEFPIRVKVTPDGEHVLVSNANSGDVAVFDVEARKEVARIPMELTAVETGEGRLFGDRFGTSPVPVGILIEPGGTRAYVANTNADLVTVLDLEAWKVTGRIAPGREPDGMAWSPLPPPAAEPTGTTDDDEQR
jgi:YVTN family beta-propeller protein